MKPATVMNGWIKVCISFLLTLAIIMLNKPADVDSEQLNQWSSNDLYRMASESARNKDYIHAAIYLFAYTQQNPPEYANNINYRTSVDSLLATYLGEVDRLRNILQDVDRHLDSCDRYPCNQASSSLDIIFVEVVPQPLPPPPDVAIICTKPNYQGTCKFLSVGKYSTYQSLGLLNDSVVSVMVGSKVKITLYSNSLGSSPSLTLTSDDPDLSNNLISGQYLWSKSVSTAKVEWR